jgi:hypothetical protein
VHLGDLGPPVWQRHARFVFDGRRWEQDEVYFVARTHRFAPAAIGLTPFERLWTGGARWWSIPDLATAEEVVYPARLATLLSSWLSDGPPPAPLLIE